MILSARATRYATRGGVIGLLWALYLVGWLVLRLEHGVPLAAAGLGFGIAAILTTLPVSILALLIGAGIEPIGLPPGESGFVIGFFITAVLNGAAAGYGVGVLVDRIRRTSYWRAGKAFGTSCASELRGRGPEGPGASTIPAPAAGR